MRRVLALLEKLAFDHRRACLIAFGVATAVLGAGATRLKIDAGFAKTIPANHPYMRTLLQYQEDFGGANRLAIALVRRDGDIFTPAFFNALRDATDEVFFLPGVNRSSVRSLFSPDVHYMEVTEEGFEGGAVVPADFQPDQKSLERVRRNIMKSGQALRLVSKDFRGALITAELMEIDPTTNQKIDYDAFSKRLEKNIRQKFQSPTVDVRIIGFVKLIGDITAATRRVLAGFAAAFLLIALLVLFYTRSAVASAILLGCSLAAVVWQLGLMAFLHVGIDPASLIVPFLTFAIAVCHGVQMINADRHERAGGKNLLDAARATFCQLIVPGSAALLTDALGFLTILAIDIPLVRGMALMATAGVAAVILINLLWLPICLSFVEPACPRSGGEDRERRTASRIERLMGRGPSIALIVLGLALGVAATIVGKNLQIGDARRGAPEFRPAARYNQDLGVIRDLFKTGTDDLVVIAETIADGCTDPDVMDGIDRFAWNLRQKNGVQTVVCLPDFAARANQMFNEDFIKWRALPHSKALLAPDVGSFGTGTGLLNFDCSAMPVHIFLTDHRAETIASVVADVKAFQAGVPSDKLKFRLASGNAGVMAAANETVKSALPRIMLLIYAGTIAAFLLWFRSWRGCLCVVAPAFLVSLLTYALMAVAGIGMGTMTLPVTAFGVGIGVDYSIYVYGRLSGYLRAGETIEQAFAHAIATAGDAVVFSAAILAVSVGTWIFSDLRFQTDMGVLMTFMFVANLIATMLFFPALAALLYRPAKK